MALWAIISKCEGYDVLRWLVPMAGPRVRAQAAAEAGNYNIPPRHHFLRPPWFILICLIFNPAPAAQPTFTNIPSLSHQKFTCCPNATGDATNENNFENSASIFWTRETWWESWTKCNCVHLYKEAWSKVHTACGKPPIVHTAYKSHSAIGKCVSVCLVQQQACDWSSYWY